jgi:hypothetical protein
MPRGQVGQQREPHSEVVPLDSKAALMHPRCSINARTTAMNGRKVRSSMIVYIVKRSVGSDILSVQNCHDG